MSVWKLLRPHKQKKLFVKVPAACWSQTVQFISGHTPHIGWSSFSPTILRRLGYIHGLPHGSQIWPSEIPIIHERRCPLYPDATHGAGIFYPYLPQKLPSYVGKYSIYGAYGLGISWFYCNYLLMLNAGNFREWSISSLSIIIPATPSNPSIPLRKNAPTQRFRPTQCVVPGDSHILVGKISIPNVFGTCPIHQVLINTIRYYPNDSPGKCGRTF